MRFYWTTFILAGLCYLVISSLLVVGVGVSNSPDESANRLFAEQFAREGEIGVTDARNGELDGIVRPRSTLVLEGRVVPKSFIGLPVLYGSIGASVGVFVIPYLTMVFGALAVLVFARLVYYATNDERFALLSGALLFLHPAFLFYSGRALMHNVPFVSFLLFALFLAVEAMRRKSVWQMGLAGVALAFAVAFRMNEVVWVAPVVFALLLYAVLKAFASRAQVLVFVLGGLFASLPFLGLNAELYGSLVKTGYQAHETPAVVIQESAEFLPTVKQDDYPGILGVLFPFGIHERAILRNATNYLVVLFPWIAVFVFIGIIALPKPARPYLLLTALISGYLVLVYASWVFYDNPDRSVITLGNSYIRYFLPIFVLTTPFIAHAFFVISKRRDFILGLLLVPFLLANLGLVLLSHDGLLKTREVLLQNAEYKEQILALTEENALIITDYADKYLYPDRGVVHPLRSERTYYMLPKMAGLGPVYYFGVTLPERDLMYLQTVRLGPVGLTISPIESFGSETLYRISSL